MITIISDKKSLRECIPSAIIAALFPRIPAIIFKVVNKRLTKNPIHVTFSASFVWLIFMFYMAYKFIENKLFIKTLSCFDLISLIYPWQYGLERISSVLLGWGKSACEERLGSLAASGWFGRENKKGACGNIAFRQKKKYFLNFVDCILDRCKIILKIYG